jgi:hypothetical protein
MRVLRHNGSRAAAKGRGEYEDALVERAEASARRAVQGAQRVEVAFSKGYDQPPFVTVWNRDNEPEVFRYVEEGE